MSSPSLDEETRDLLLREHGALREEILLRIRQQHELLALAWVAFGILIALALHFASPTFASLYVVLVMFVAASWQHNGVRTVQIKIYILEDLEPRLFGGATEGGWERALRGMRARGFLGACWTVSTKGFLIGTQTLATLTSLYCSTSTVEPWILLSGALVVQGSTLMILRYPRIERDRG